MSIFSARSLLCLTVLFGLASLSPYVANAQQGQSPAPAILGVFGNILNQAQQAQAAKQRQDAATAWSSVDPRIAECLQNNFRDNIQQLIQSGVMPGDPRLSNSINQCNQAIANAQEQQRQQAAAQAKAQADAERDRHAREVAAQAALIKAKADADRAKADAEAKAEAAAKQRQEELASLRDELQLDQLVGDDPRDLTVLIVSHDTPRMIRNLSGDATFRGRVDGCSMLGPLSFDSSTPEGRFDRAMMDTVVQKGGGSIFVVPCLRSDFGRFDLLVFSVGQLSNADPEMLQPLVTAVKDGSYVKYAIYRQGDYETQLQARKAQVEEDEHHQEQARIAAKADFQTRDDGVISAIYAKTPASSVCLGGSPDGGLRYLVGRTDSPFADLITTRSILQDVATKDAMFLAYKTGDCDAVVAPTAIIKDILPALDRDSVTANFHSATISAARLAQWRDLAKSASSSVSSRP